MLCQLRERLVLEKEIEAKQHVQVRQRQEEDIQQFWEMERKRKDDRMQAAGTLQKQLEARSVSVSQ